MKTKTPERDATLAAAYVGVAGSGLLLSGVGTWARGAGTGLSIALGVGLALTNLWALERVVHLYLRSDRGRWAALGLSKAAVLFVAVAFLVKSGAVDLLPLVLGFGALPLGVVIAGLWPVPRASEEI